MLSFVVLIAAQDKIMNYEIFRADKSIGTAKMAIKILADGGKRSDSKLVLALGDQKLDMHTTQMWSKTGRPTLKIIQMFDANGVETSRTRVDFHLTDLLVTQTAGSKITKTTKAIPANVEIRDLPEFWFLREAPMKGKPYKYLVFNATSLEWESATSVYTGDEEKTKSHMVTQTIGSRKSTISLNDAGVPMVTVTNDGIRIAAKN